MKKPYRISFSSIFFRIGLGLCLCFACWSCNQEPVEIVFSHGPDDSGVLQALINDFNEAHAGDIYVKWQQSARLSNEYYREIEQDQQSDHPEIDVISADVVWTPSFADKGWVENISSQFFNTRQAQEFVPAALSSASFRNDIWGVPWYTDFGVLFYRKDLLEQHGFDNPPITWSDVQLMAQAVQKSTFIKNGYVFQGANYEGGVANACEFIWNAGGQILLGDLSVQDEELEGSLLTVNSEESINGLKKARNLVEVGVVPSNIADFKEAEALAEFEKGDALFMRSWPAVVHRIIAGEAPVGRDQIGVTRLPVLESGQASYSCLGGWNLMVSAHSNEAEKEAAWTFIEYLTAEPQQRELALKGGNLPVLRSLYDDERLLAEVPTLALAKEVLPNARLRPITPHYMELAPDIAWAFSETLQDNLTPEEAVETIEGLFQSIILASY